uniref:Uncharacterized protein n=1 Tax=Timema poppense TaxID=170557 RepID=A0A7R9CMB1_TIMPO|nr:unnamed protein product [Timema poppensis]
MEQDVNKIKNIMMDNIDPPKYQINIRSMRPTEKLLLVETETEKDVNKIVENKDLKQELKCEGPRLRRPMTWRYNDDCSCGDPTPPMMQAIYDLRLKIKFELLISEAYYLVKKNRTTVHLQVVGYGILKAIHGKQPIELNRITKDVVAFYAGDFPELVEKLQLDLHEPPISQGKKTTHATLQTRAMPEWLKAHKLNHRIKANYNHSEKRLDLTMAITAIYSLSILDYNAVTAFFRRSGQSLGTIVPSSLGS